MSGGLIRHTMRVVDRYAVGGSTREWRNGRRAVFRWQCPYGRGGSNPPSRTRGWSTNQPKKLDETPGQVIWPGVFASGGALTSLRPSVRRSLRGAVRRCRAWWSACWPVTGASRRNCAAPCCTFPAGGFGDPDLAAVVVGAGRVRAGRCPRRVAAAGWPWVSCGWPEGCGGGRSGRVAARRGRRPRGRRCLGRRTSPG